MASTTAPQQLEPKKKAPRQGFQEYIKGVRHELKSPQTHWPTRPELIRMTQVVLLLITSVAIYCGGLDFILAQLTSRALPHK
jgi:preprotein translocase SecE subunit